MTRGVRLGIGLMLAAVASAAYWLAVLGLLEYATRFNYTTGAEPDDGVMLIKAGAVMTLGPLLYAALLFLVSHLRGVRAAATTIGFGVVAGLYWSFVAFFLLGATAGDARDGVTPNLGMQRTVLIATLVLAPIIFALMLKAWRDLIQSHVRGR